jgi:hypothetical protein
VYEGTDIVVTHTEAEYGGNLEVQICNDGGIVYFKCTTLDIKNLSDYKEIKRVNGNEFFPIYTYINKHVQGAPGNKIYFLYRTRQESKLSDSSWTVYNDPLSIISFNTETKEVKKEGQLSITGLGVKDLQISPSGSYLLIVDGPSHGKVPLITSSNIVLFDLKNKTTKIFETGANNDTLEFMDWIDDTHFFYKKSKSGDRENVVYRIGEIN